MSLAFIAAMVAAPCGGRGPIRRLLEIQYVSTETPVPATSGREAPEQLENGREREAARLQKADLPGLFAIVRGGCSEAALPQREHRRVVLDRRVADGVLDRVAAYALALELAPNMATAVASGLLRDQRVRKTLVRQQALRRELVQHGGDFIARRALGDQALLELVARIFAPRQQANRLRLERDRLARSQTTWALALRVRDQRRTRRACDRHADDRADLGLDLCRDVLVLAQPFARVVLALAYLVAVVGVPRAGLLDDVVRDAELDDLAFARNALAVQDVEQGFAKRRRDLVLDDLDPRLVADDFLAALDRSDAADVEPH